MQSLVTRFHLLLFAVTLAIAGVGAIRIPDDFVYLAHWSGNHADWLWPREAIFLSPAIQLGLMAAFLMLGRALTKNHYAKSQHILDPFLTLLMSVVASTQLGLLFAGIGSDLDIMRVTGFGLSLLLLVLGVVLFEAERHTYAGLRMPWPIRSDHAWLLVHRVAGLAFGLSGLWLLALAWLDAGIGLLTLAFSVALIAPPLLAGLVTLTTRNWSSG